MIRGGWAAACRQECRVAVAAVSVEAWMRCCVAALSPGGSATGELAGKACGGGVLGEEARIERNWMDG